MGEVIGKIYGFDQVLSADGWQEDACVEVGGDGLISRVGAAEPGQAVEWIGGIALPGMANVHSHAFQLALAGASEPEVGVDDDFWSWRANMYKFLEVLGPDDLLIISRALGVMLLENGFTSLGEFHYLHHDQGGVPYADKWIMAKSLIAGLAEAGMPLTLLPALYMSGAMDGTALEGPQKRFELLPDDLSDLISTLDCAKMGQNCRMGLALHSLRAVPEPVIRDVGDLRGLFNDDNPPTHMHIAEQQAEVLAAIDHYSSRPVDWLLDHVDLDEGWCLIHATRISESECARLGSSFAIVGLCPTTEANLGDGLFPLEDFRIAGGRFALGSDSHVGLSAAGEIRLLDYGQRLIHQRRSLVGLTGGLGLGQYYWDHAAQNGARVLGQNAGAIEAGRRADLVVLPATGALVGLSGDKALDMFIFSDQIKPDIDVMTSGKWVVRQGRHVAHEALLAPYFALLGKLRGL